ncbi:MAG: HAMP domain-containing histidine kinase [Clostridiales bacterium]|nr:HAMP domain-containing histidine kinase [Clostridiales bacterium]
MIWAILLLGFSLCVSAGLLLSYRRQIRSLTQDLSFLAQHDSNLQMNSRTGMKSLHQLEEAINALLRQHRDAQNTARRRDAQIRDTITSLSHDIRTPLTSLDGYFQLLAESGDAQEQARYTEIIRSRIASLNTMLEELFTYTKLQHNDYRLELEPVNVSQLLMETAFSFYEEFQAKKIVPEFQIPETPCTMLCSPQAMKHVFQNILKNVLEHGRERLSVTLEERDGNVAMHFRNLCAEDEEPAQAEQLFERFYKGDRARGKRSSTGLGLYITKELTQRMGGTISARIEPDQDNTAAFILQLSFPAASPK